MNTTRRAKSGELRESVEVEPDLGQEVREGGGALRVPVKLGISAVEAVAAHPREDRRKG